MTVTKIIEDKVVGEGASRYQTAGGTRQQTLITVVTTGWQPCELVATGSREKKEIRKQINWEPVKIESM